MNARKVILNLLEKFDKQPQRLDWLMERSALLKRLEPRDRRLVMEIVYGIIRNLTRLDFIINHFLKGERLKENTILLRLLRLGAYQIIYLDRIPDHAAVNETVKLAKEDRRSSDVSGVINAVLRNLIKQKNRLPQPSEDLPLVERLSVQFSHPEWLVERWLKRLGLGKTKALLQFNNTRPDIYLRRKIKGLTRTQFDTESRSICDTGRGYMNLFYRLEKTVAPESIILFKEGRCTVQAPSSGWVVAMLDAACGDRIVDVCAAPGGKSSLLAELVTDSGAIVACDLRFRRVKQIIENINRMTLDNVYTLVCDGISTPFNGCFDKVLLDAPCSATGVMHRHPEARWTSCGQDIQRLVQLQSKLLDGVSSIVAPKGVLVYSTCSIEPEENEEQVEHFLKKHPDFSLEPAPDSIPDTFIDLEGRLTITPFEHKTDGMFAVRLRRG